MTTKKTLAHIKSSSTDQPYRRGGGTWWLVPRPFALMSSLLYIGVLVPFLYSFVPQTGYNPALTSWQAVLMIVTIVLLLGVDRLEYRLYGEETRPRAAIFMMAARIALIEVVTWLDKIQYSPFLYLIVPFLACLYFGEIVGYCLAILAEIAYFIEHFYYSAEWLSNGTELHYLVLFTVGLVLVITIARVVNKEKASRARAEELLAELEVSHQQLKDYAGQVAELATTRERNRLARDIHDSLGHYLAVINVQLEKALAFRAKKPREADQAVSDAKQLASEALQDVRRSVSALRATEELPELIPSLATLAERVRSDHCLVELHIEGSEDGFSKPGLLTLYRAAQEGLTNIQKHAGASHAWIELHFGEQEATLSLRDNGHGFDPLGQQHLQPGREGGYGLQGLQERLELVGGSLKVESVPVAGTSLRVTVPKNS